MYDYQLGGSRNFAADRAAAQEFLAGWPDAQLTMLANRAFLGRAVRYLAAEADTGAPDMPPAAPPVTSAWAPRPR